MSDIGEAVRSALFAHRDEAYRAFFCPLVPTLNPETVLGVRAPALRQLSRALLRREDALDYLQELPHQFYEENLVHCRFLESIRDFDTVMAELERFLPCVNNWAVCDSLNPPALRRHLPELLPTLRRWMGSEACYTVRFAVGTLMRHCLEPDTFRAEYLDWVAELDREEYYVRMMQAWFFATALAKQYQSGVKVLEDSRLPLWVHNKSIQKAVESRRLLPEQKAYLKTLRRGAGRGSV